MLRLCSESSCPYTPQGGTELSPGRSARYAAKVATGAGLRPRPLPKGGMVTGNEPGKAGRSHPAEGPNPK